MIVVGEFAKKRWLQMRDRYRKELKSALRNGIIPKWPYFEKLNWLDPYLKDNKPGSISATFIPRGFNHITEDDDTPSFNDNSELFRCYIKGRYCSRNLSCFEKMKIVTIHFFHD